MEKKRRRVPCLQCGDLFCEKNPVKKIKFGLGRQTTGWRIPPKTWVLLCGECDDKDDVDDDDDDYDDYKTKTKPRCPDCGVVTGPPSLNLRKALGDMGIELEPGWGDVCPECQELYTTDEEEL